MVGYTTGLATASFFGDTLEGQKRPGQNVTINGKFYKGIDGYMIAGPQWANYMLEGGRTLPRRAFPAAAGVHDPEAAARPRRPCCPGLIGAVSLTLARDALDPNPHPMPYGARSLYSLAMRDGGKFRRGESRHRARVAREYR